MFGEIVVRGIITRRISTRVGVLGSYFPATATLALCLFESLAILGVPVIVQLRDRIALVLYLKRTEITPSLVYF